MGEAQEPTQNTSRRGDTRQASGTQPPSASKTPARTGTTTGQGQGPKEAQEKASKEQSKARKQPSPKSGAGHYLDLRKKRNKQTQATANRQPHTTSTTPTHLTHLSRDEERHKQAATNRQPHTTQATQTGRRWPLTHFSATNKASVSRRNRPKG